MMATVKIKNLTKRFGNVIAVDKVSLDVYSGEFLVLLGPSGCGKTTTLRCIAGLETPDEGEIYIDDVLVNDLPPKERNVALMFQSYALYPNKTVYENLAFPLRSRNVPEEEIEARARKVAETLHIDHLFNRFPRQLSGGERQRVAMGRAIISNVKVILLDEPLTNIDAKLRVEARTELKRLQREFKITTIYTTPDSIEALSMADRIAVMNKGRIVQCDKPEILYDKPKDTFVAGFIGSPPMNFFDCTLVVKNGKYLLDAGEFVLDVSEFRDQLEGRVTNPELILGIRPEHISISKHKTSKECIEAEVQLFEPTRPDSILYLTIGKKGLAAIVPSPSKYNVKERVWVTFNNDRIHIFDKKQQIS